MKTLTLVHVLFLSLLISSCGPGKSRKEDSSAKEAVATAEDAKTAEAGSPEYISPKFYDDVGDFVRVKNSNYGDNNSSSVPPESTSSQDSSSSQKPSGTSSSTGIGANDVAPEYVTSGDKKFPIKRERLRLQNVKYNYDLAQKRMDLKGDVLFNDEKSRYFELSGIYKNGFVALSIQDAKSELKNVFKAKVTCLESESAELECKEFYADFYYVNAGVIYTDQLIPKVVVQNIQTSGQAAAAKAKESFSDQLKEGEEVEGEVDDSQEEIESVDAEESEGGFFSGDTQNDIGDLFPNLKQEAVVVPPQAQTTGQAKPIVKPVNPSGVKASTGGTAPKPVPVVRPGVGAEVPSAQVGAKPQTPPVRVKPGTTPAAPTKPAAPAPVVVTNNYLNPNIFDVPNRPRDQSIGKPSAGRLQNASSLVNVLNQIGSAFQFQIFGRVVAERKFFGTYDMIVVIENIVKWAKKSFPEQLISVGNVSKQKGGDTDGKGGQASHQSGIDADIGYFTTNKKSEKMAVIVDPKRNKVTSDFLIDKQWALFKKIYSTKAVDMIIVDPVIKTALCHRAVALGEFKKADSKALATAVLNRIYPDKKYRGKKRNMMHANHFHLRIKCGKYNPRCWQALTKDQGLGCIIK